MKKLLALTLMLALVCLVGCKSESGDEAAQAPANDEPQAVKAEPTAETPELITKPSGVRYVDLVVGEGVEATDQMRVECHYTLWFADSTGLEKVERFQSSKDGGQSFTCTLGRGLIPGWTDGMIGMKEGGTRQIHIPWALGYGDAEGGRIPAKTNLIFEIDFLKAL